jgi:hypothetical protein
MTTAVRPAEQAEPQPIPPRIVLPRARRTGIVRHLHVEALRALPDGGRELSAARRMGKDPDAPDADPVGLMNRSFAALAEPI